MQARRILLFMAIALLMAGAAASLVPVPDETGGTDGGASSDDMEDPATAGDGADRPAREGRDREGSAEVTFRASKPPRTSQVDADRRVVVTVTSTAPGQVELRGLGALQPVAAQAPAVFDLFTDTRGRFDVVYTPVDGPERRLGTLVVR